SHRGRAVALVHAADAYADHRHAVGVSIVARERLAPDLAGAVEPARPHWRLVGQARDALGLVVPPRHQVAQRRVLLPAADGGAAAGEDHARHTGQARRLEDVV